jgi:large subunit ribosomal protein L29
VKIQQIRELDASELARRETQLRDELFNLRIQMVSGQLENVKRVRTVKKEIAQVKTIAREKRLSPSKTPTER